MRVPAMSEHRTLAALCRSGKPADGERAYKVTFGTDVRYVWAKTAAQAAKSSMTVEAVKQPELMRAALDAASSQEETDDG